MHAETKHVEQESTNLAVGDLETVSRVVMLRLDKARQEEHRLAQTAELLDTANALSRALVTHTRHALVHRTGTHGTGDLTADARTLHCALRRYSQVVRSIAADYQPQSTRYTTEAAPRPFSTDIAEAV